MDREETLKHPKCPDWLKRASWEGNVAISLYGAVIWCNGVWKRGIWGGGVWENGTWHDGVWEGGEWEGGEWERGIWRDGIWKNGTWHNGVWRGGTWYRGVWRYGQWDGGVWLGGKWLGGASSVIRTKYAPRILDYGDIQIGCKIKSAEQWLEWLDSDEEYDTPRNSEEWSEIEDAIRLACFKVELLEKRKGK